MEWNQYTWLLVAVMAMALSTVKSAGKENQVTKAESADSSLAQKHKRSLGGEYPNMYPLMTVEDPALLDQDVDKRGTLFRFGKRGSLFRFGKRGTLFRFGKRGSTLFRFGKRDQDKSDRALMPTNTGREVDEDALRSYFLESLLANASPEQQKRVVDSFHWGQEDE